MIRYHDKPKREGVSPRSPHCRCGKPLSIVIKPGEHIHPCPVHPEFAVYGRNVQYQ